MNQYNKRISIERSLIKKINQWFPKKELHGLSWGALNKWATENNISSEQVGFKKLNEISSLLVSLANRSQEVVDPKAITDISFIESEIMKLKYELFTNN